MRHFIVFFACVYEDLPSNGNIVIVSKGMINRNTLQDKLEDSLGLENVVITGIIEATKEDSMAFSGGEYLAI